MNCAQRFTANSSKLCVGACGPSTALRALPEACEVQQAAVLRVQIGEQRVVDRQLGGGLGAADGQRQHGVGAVGVVVDQLRTGRDRAGLAVAAHGQPRQRIGGNLAVLGAHFAPGDLAVAVGVQADGEIQVAQCDVPLAADFAGADGDRQVAVGRLVRLGRREPGESQAKRDDEALHFAAPDLAASACSTTLSTRLACSQSRTGAAASG